MTSLRKVMRARVVIIPAALLLSLVSTTWATAYHATLLRSTPAANSKLSKRPDTVRLVFSEAVVPDLSQIGITGADSVTVQLGVANDPHDVHVLVGTVPPGAIDMECTGTPCLARYRLTWHVVSADGHPVSGAFVFSVANQHKAASGAGAVATSTRPTPPLSAAPHDTGMPDGMTDNSEHIPWLISFLRGTGLGTIMAAVGLLVFGFRRTAASDTRFRSRVSKFASTGAVLLIAHMFGWLKHIAPAGHLTTSTFTASVGSGVGRWELARVLLALLMVWAIALARSDRIALAFGILCLLASGAVGHPAAITSAWTVPAKMAHLAAGAVWLGGLLWLIWTYRNNKPALAPESQRVSRAAFYSMLLVLFSGIIQIRFFINAPAELLSSTYGKLALAKIVGLLILIGYGAYNRYRAMPALAGSTGQSLNRSVRQEIVVMSVLILVGGLLAYVPTPAVVPTPSETLGLTK